MSNSTNPTLLPPNRTKLEMDLEAILASKYERTDASIIKSLFDPLLCPETLLPWLAWAYSIDVWNDSWNTDMKRQIVANAFKVHQIKGTLAGIEESLKLLGLEDASVVEWFNADDYYLGGRGTAEISFGADYWLQTSANFKDVLQTIKSNKRLSIHTSLLINEKTPIIDSRHVSGVAHIHDTSEASAILSFKTSTIIATFAELREVA